MPPASGGNLEAIRAVVSERLRARGTLIATQAMIFWLLFLCCALSAWLIGYGMGYLRGVREAITGDASASTTNPVDVDRD